MNRVRPMNSAPEDRVIPDSFRQGMLNHYGDEGALWLQALPDILDTCETRWQVDISSVPVPNLSWNYIATARTHDGRDAVVKVGPSNKNFLAEMEALKLFNGQGMVRLYEADVELSAMLLERLSPGTSLIHIQQSDDEEATRLAAPVIRDVAVPVPLAHALRHLADRVEVLDRVRNLLDDCRLTLYMVDKAQHILETLEGTKQKDMLIHGDLHHDNILFDKIRGWTAIDPKGIIGDHVFNVACFMNNWWGMERQTDRIQGRLDIFSSIMEIEEKRLIGWTYVDMIIGAAGPVLKGRPHEVSEEFTSYIKLLDPFINRTF